MTYNTPELLRIGSAQNMILGDGVNNSAKPVPQCLEDSEFAPTSDENEAW